MEKKTMGAFIATMRKAKGMTQFQLADRLGVSNKTISHWECDESAPDLSLIPEIADIFGITCDELLRGELNTIESFSNVTMPAVDDTVNEERKIKDQKSYLNKRFIIFAGLEVIGMTTVFAGLLTASLSALFGGALMIGAFVLILTALIEVSNNVYDCESQTAKDFKRYIYNMRFAAISAFVTLMLFCFVFRYWNLILSGACIVISVLVYFIVANKKGYLNKSFKSKKNDDKNFKNVDCEE